MAQVIPFESRAPKALEFFAGIGLARMGLEASGFDVIWSNDIEPAKRRMYVGHYGDDRDRSHVYDLRDISTVTANELPAKASLAWASSPCTDLSLAGGRAGLRGLESGTFWEFTRIVGELGDAKPPVIVLENVVGLATSHGGADLKAAVQEFNDLGYSVDVLTLDARRFVPQSRPRLFLVGALNPPQDGGGSSRDLRPAWLDRIFEDDSLVTHRAALPEPPELLAGGLSGIVEQLSDTDERWWSEERTSGFLASLSPVQSQRLSLLQEADSRTFRTAYRRTRQGVPMWEIRADDISGCLRTARGGSSKQAVVQIERQAIKVRWMTSREYARLMGAEKYALGETRDSQALFGFGDAVAVPVVEWLATNYLRPLIAKAELGFGTVKQRLALL